MDAQFQWPREGQPHGGRALGLLPCSHRAPPFPLCDTIGWGLPAGGAFGIKGLQGAALLSRGAEEAVVGLWLLSRLGARCGSSQAAFASCAWLSKALLEVRQRM